MKQETTPITSMFDHLIGKSIQIPILANNQYTVLGTDAANGWLYVERVTGATIPPHWLSLAGVQCIIVLV